MSILTRFIRRFSGDERLLRVQLTSAADFAYSASNFWVFTLILKTYKPNGDLETYGSPIADPYSLETRSLSAGVTVTVFNADQGLAVKDGAELWATMVSTGSPAAVNGYWTTDRQRIAR